MKFEKIEDEETFRKVAAENVGDRPHAELIIVEGEIVAVRVGRTRISATKGVGITLHQEIET